MKSNRNLKIFITGHNGMVGRAVLNFFKKKKFKKIIYANRKKLDLENKKNLFKFIKKNKPDVVINCAGKVGGIKANNSKKIEFLNRNLDINKNIIESCYKFKISRLIFLGSSCVYPNDIKNKIKEEDLLSSKLEPTNEAYALSKIVGLRLCQYYNENYNTDYRCLMPCNLFGQNDNYDNENSHVLPALIKKIHEAKIKNKKYVDVWGNGKPKREFMYVNDLAKIIFQITFCKKSKFKKYSYESILNVGSQDEFTIKQLAIKISTVLKYKPKIKFIKKSFNGTLRKKLDNSRLRKILKSFKYTNFTKSLKKTYIDYLANV